jgi:proline dehydrogenase
VANLLGRAVLGVTNRSVVRRAVTRTRPGRALSRRFVAGEKLEDVIAVAKDLNEKGFSVSLDHLGEYVSDETKALQARDDYLAAIDAIAIEGLDANVSVKLTQLGLGTNDDLARGSLTTIAQLADDRGTTVTIDMEDATLTEATIQMYEKAQKEHGNLGIAIQAYLHRSVDDISRIASLGGHIRLCKGAYAEPPEVAFQSAEEVDANFDLLLGQLMRIESTTPAIATHDEARIAAAEAAATNREHSWEFQMLYGVRTKMQQSILDSGRPLRVYVPYGDAWYPYLTRRLAERPANVWFFARAAVSRG